MPSNQWPKPQPPPSDSRSPHSPIGRSYFLDLLLGALNLLIILAIPALFLLALMDLAVLHRPLPALGKSLLAIGCWWVFRRLPL